MSSKSIAFLMHLLLLSHLALAGWTDYVEKTIDSVRFRGGHLRDDPWDSPSELCSNREIWRFTGFFQFVVSDWLTIAPSHVPDAGASATIKWIDVEMALNLASQSFLVSDPHNCVEAKFSFSLFSSIVTGITSPMKADIFSSSSFEDEALGVPSMQLTWRQIATSEWPILALITQRLRLEAQLFPETPDFYSESRACKMFLELVPDPPFDAYTLLSSAIRFLDEPVYSTPACDLALSLALAILVQGLPKEKALSASGVIVSLFAGLSDGFAAARSKIFYLLDQVLFCHGKVDVSSIGKRQFTMHVPAVREHIADRIRYFRVNHCGLENYVGVSLEEEVLHLLQSGREELLVLEVGSALGQCLLPLLLIQPPRVRALSVEPVQHLRHLFSESLEDNTVSDMVKFISNAVVPKSVPTGAYTINYDVGHHTSVDGGDDINLINRGPKTIGFDGVIPSIRPFSLKQETRSVTLSDVIASQHVDLLIVYPLAVCESLSSGLEDVKCERRLGNRFPYCIFVDCTVLQNRTSARYEENTASNRAHLLQTKI